MIDTLVLSSGGTKGISFIGALDYLNKYCEEFEETSIYKYIGTSVGALICSFLSLGIRIDELKKIIFDTHFISFFSDIKILNFVNTMGVVNPANIKTKMEEVLKSKGIDPCVSLVNLYDITKKELYLVSTDLISEKIVYISHKTFPDMMLVDAVMSSMSIPLIFPPVKYKSHYFVDGALLETVCFNKDIIGENPVIIDIVRERSERILNIGDYILKIVNTVINNKNCCPPDFKHYYIIKTNEKNILDTNLDKCKIDNLLLEGYESIKSCVKVKHE